MSNEIRKFIDSPSSLPQNYQIYLEGIDSRADVFLVLEFPPFIRPIYKYPTKKNIITYLEILGVIHCYSDAVVIASRIDRVVKSMKSGYSVNKWSAIKYEVNVDHSMILRRPQATVHQEFIRKLFHYGECRTSNTK